MSAVPEPVLARRQHDRLVKAYLSSGVTAFYVEPRETPPPNLMFVADLFFMTPEGAIVARPASTVRAGEERHVSRKLAELDIPILRCVRGEGVFEGADASWIDSDRVILATGLRTNSEGADQVSSILHEMDVEVVRVKLPVGAMHLMGTLRFTDEDLAICWMGRTPNLAIKALKEYGKEVVFIPDTEEATRGKALNFVTLGPMRIIMPAGNPRTLSFYKDLGIECVAVEVSELHKEAGGIGCLSGILKRQE
jgi:N-dimethylarginine dimethylaminohydrolase